MPCCKDAAHQPWPACHAAVNVSSFSAVRGMAMHNSVLAWRWAADKQVSALHPEALQIA